MARVEAPTKNAKFRIKLKTTTSENVAHAAKTISQMAFTSLGRFEFFTPKNYFLMKRDNLLMADLTDDQSLFTATNYMYDASRRIFDKSTFDSYSWKKTMIRTLGDLRVDTDLSLDISQYARGFLQFAQSASAKLFIDGDDPAMEYVAARSYLYARDKEHYEKKRDKKRKISSGDMRLTLSLVNSLDYTQDNKLKYTLATPNTQTLRKHLSRTRADRTEEGRNNLAMERRLQVFAQMNNLQVMQPLLDELAQDIVTSATGDGDIPGTQTMNAEYVMRTRNFRKTKKKEVVTTKVPDSLREIAFPNKERLDRFARREKITQQPNERVGRFTSEWDHTQPTTIANSAMFVDTPHGKGWMPFESSQTMDAEALQTDDAYRQRMAKIKEVYIVQHGVMRNAKDYQRYFMEALGKTYDPETMLVISPQFLAPVDLKEPKRLWDKEHKRMWGKLIDPDKILRWRYNDWKGAEPAMNPDNPVDSFTAMDSLLEWTMQFTPNAQLEMLGNSEGGQFMDRYLAFSKYLNILQYTRKTPVKINGIYSNPGSVLNWAPHLPVFNKEGKIIKWKDYAFDSRENTWPFGLYDLTPYVMESLNEWPNDNFSDYPHKNRHTDPYEFALWNYLNRSIMAIGEEDNVLGGFHLPKGPGPAFYAQGNTRFRRMLGKFHSLGEIITRKPHGYYPQPGMVVIGGVEHNAWDVFKALVPYLQYIRIPENSPDLVH